jgi:hypothetical protein
MNCGHMWGLGGPTCVVLSRLSLARCILIQISLTLSNMSGGLIVVFKRSDATSFYIVNDEDDIDYFVVKP